jgi:hypothetical protein
MRIQLASACVILLTLAACGPQTGSTQPAGAPTFGPSIIDAPNAPPGSPPADQGSPEPTRSLLPPESLTTAELHQRLDPFSGWMPDCARPAITGWSPGIYDSDV